MSFSIGPLALSIQIFIVMIAVVVAWFVAVVLGRLHRAPAADALFSLVLVALVGARLVFVARYWPSFVESPLSIIDIRDAGFDIWGALVVGALWLAWRLSKDAAMRKPLLISVATGLGVWGITTAMLSMAEQQGREIPMVELRVPQHQGLRTEAMQAVLDAKQANEMAQPVTDAVGLRDIAAGQGTIVNIWATWCPPCRREMPVLEKAQNKHENLRFVFVNQGEGEGKIRSFLQGEGLFLDHVYLDPHGSLSAALGAHGLPTTLFYNAEGQLVDVRMGELSAATLQRSIEFINTP